MASELSVEVQDHSVRVSRTGASMAVTFRRDCGSGILEAEDFIGNPFASDEDIQFVAAAWRLAYAEARRQGWLRTMNVNGV